MTRESLFNFPKVFDGSIITCKEKKTTVTVPAGYEVL